jgi:hypothetical protein
LAEDLVNQVAFPAPEKRNNPMQNYKHCIAAFTLALLSLPLAQADTLANIKAKAFW